MAKITRNYRRRRRVPAPIKIRKARSSDSAELIRIASWWPVGSRIVPLDETGCVAEGGAVRNLRDPAWCILVAVDTAGSGIVGYAVGFELTAELGRFGLSEKPTPTTRIAQLEELHVVPEYERRGIGTRLVRRFEDWAKHAGCVAVTLAGGPAPGLYENLGYVRRGPFFSYVRPL